MDLHPLNQAGMGCQVTAGVLYRAGAEMALSFQENFRVSLSTVFLGDGYQTAVVVSTAKD